MGTVLIGRISFMKRFKLIVNLSKYDFEDSKSDSNNTYINSPIIRTYFCDLKLFNYWNKININLYWLKIDKINNNNKREIKKFQKLIDNDINKEKFILRKREKGKYLNRYIG